MSKNIKIYFKMYMIGRDANLVQDYRSFKLFFKDNSLHLFA